MRRTNHDDSDPVRTTDPPSRRSAGAPAAIVAALVAGVALLALGPLSGGVRTEPPARSTTTVVGPDPFDVEFQATSTTLSSVVTPDDLPDAFGLDATDVQVIDERSVRAAEFWTLVGDGDADGARMLLDDRIADTLGPLTGFLAEFRAHLQPSVCGPYGSNGVSCTVLTTDPTIAAIGLGRPSEMLLIAFGPSGIDYLQTPTVLGSASLKLAGHARTSHPEAFAAACGSAADALDVRPRVGTLVATPECGRYLAGLVPEYLAVDSG